MAEKLARTNLVTVLRPDVLLVDAAMAEPPELRFRAGQFISIRIDEGGGQRRSYSILSNPTRTDGFELLVKLLPDGAGSDFFARLRPGDPIPFTGPMGFFVCDLAHPGDVVFAATGSGLAAALPMAEETLARDEPGRVLLYWGLRHEEDIYLADRLAALAARCPRFHYEICLSRPGPGWTGATGRITGHVLGKLGELDRPIFYLVGHGTMVKELRAELVARGVDRKKQTRVEVFYPAADE